MGVVRKSLDEIRASRPTVDRSRIRSTSDADIEKQIAADPDLAPDMSEATVPPEPRSVRLAAGLTQDEFARMLDIPVATLRNWEQKRTQPDRSAKALFRLMAKDVRRALRLLAS